MKLKTLVGVALLASILSGCIIVPPAHGPGYYRPGWGYRGWR